MVCKISCESGGDWTIQILDKLLSKHATNYSRTDCHFFYKLDVKSHSFSLFIHLCKASVLYHNQAVIWLVIRFIHSRFSHSYYVWFSFIKKIRFFLVENIDLCRPEVCVRGVEGTNLAQTVNTQINHSCSEIGQSVEISCKLNTFL